MIDKQELFERLREKFGDLDNDGGCYVFVNGDYEWLSVSAIVEVINECDEYDE